MDGPWTAHEGDGDWGEKGSGFDGRCVALHSDGVVPFFSVMVVTVVMRSIRWVRWIPFHGRVSCERIDLGRAGSEREWMDG